MNRYILFFTLLCLLSTSGCKNKGTEVSPSASGSPVSSEPVVIKDGQPSPKFQLTAPDGSTVNFNPAENPDKEVFMLLFWSYRWDPNVQTLLSRTAELHERYAPRGLTIIGVSYDEEPAGLRDFLSKNKVPFDVAVGKDSTYKSFAVSSIPAGVLVDASGRIVERWNGYFSTEELAALISPHLPGRGGNSTE